MATSSSSELLQARTELWNIVHSYLKPIALRCAINLGIPNAIYNCGGSASLADLLAVVPVPEHRKPYLRRLMRFLAATGIVAFDVPSADGCTTEEASATGVYHLTPMSRLLVDDVDVNGCINDLSSFALLCTTKYYIMASMHLSEWFKGEDRAGSEMPFKMAHGMNIWDFMCHDPQFNELFNTGMACDSQLVLNFVVTTRGDVFDGISSLVDVGGGTGSAARAIAEAFPHVKCSVLDLPNVISSIQPVDGVVEFIAGDMMDSIPPTDAVLLKSVLHDWNDDECVKILTQCKKAICSRNPASGKVIIIDTIIGSPSKAIFEAQVTVDLMMMVLTSGKEREEHQWHKIFMDAGFGHYKARPVMGFLSIIELYL
ncbi:O-methyltransferase ZRP4-like [Phragmites australis]|uniref:O-methyltransferase ZRP4-like n=1 Tax=Phragmites australis TaxID=29695 RepID=UPI002D76B384|nr:O-methyltransferase ZRP4-like [Phragmites australis]